MIKVTFPDGSIREFEDGITGLQIAERLSAQLGARGFGVQCQWARA